MSETTTIKEGESRLTSIDWLCRPLNTRNMNIEQQHKLKELQDNDCRIKVDHHFYVADFGTVFEYTEEYIKAEAEDNQARTVGEFGYRSNAYSDLPLSQVNPSSVWICRRFEEN